MNVHASFIAVGAYHFALYMSFVLLTYLFIKHGRL